MTTEHRGITLETGLRTTVLEQGAPASGAPAALPTVVMLHAWGESRHAFGLLLPKLPAGLHVLVPDARGHGAADKPPAGYQLADLARDVVGVLDHWEQEAAVLVGASSGGYVAQQVAVQHPRRVAGLVLTGTPHDLHGLRPPFAAEVEALTDPVDPAWAHDLTASMLVRTDLPAGFQQLMARDAARIPAAVLLASLLGLTRSRPPTDHGTITAPTLILTGEQDPFLSTQTPGLVAAIPNSQSRVYQDCGHLVHLEAPLQLARDLLSFTEGLSDQAR